MTEEESEIEAWKLAIARATAYVQSNALFQVQLFGFYSSVVVITFGLCTDQSNRLHLLRYVIPTFSFVTLYVSCYYFNRLTTQHVFIRIHGLRYYKDSYIKSPDGLWEHFKLERNISLINAIRYLFTYDSTGPYQAFFLLYVGVGIVSVSFSYSTQNDKYLGIENNLISIIIALVFAVLYIAAITKRAWRVIEYERKFKLGIIPLLRNEADRVPR
jgi:hypothetical protein